MRGTYSSGGQGGKSVKRWGGSWEEKMRGTYSSGGQGGKSVKRWGGSWEIKKGGLASCRGQGEKSAWKGEKRCERGDRKVG